MTSSKELAYYHNVGQEDASKNTSRSSIFSSPDEKRAYLDGYYHALGQKDYRENKYSGFTIQGWIFSDDDDRANLDAYNAGHDAAGAIGGDTSINEISEHPPGMSIDSSSLHEWIFVFVGLLFFFGIVLPKIAPRISHAIESIIGIAIWAGIAWVVFRISRFIYRKFFRPSAQNLNSKKSSFARFQMAALSLKWLLVIPIAGCVLYFLPIWSGPPSAPRMFSRPAPLPSPSPPQLPSSQRLPDRNTPRVAQTWRAYVEKVMRQILPKEAKCTRGIDASKCEYNTAKFKLEFYGSDGMLGAAEATVEFRPPLTQGEQDVGKDMVFAFFKTFNFNGTAIRNCIGRGFQRDQWSPEQVKNTNKEFKLECYGAGTWNLVMKKNNEF